MAYVREEIRGTSGQDIMKMNENFMNIFQKVFGDINFSDVDNLMKSAINTQWISFQGEGNLDSNYNYTVRFFVPPNVKEVKGASFNAILERYRMDSGVANSGGGYANGSVALSLEEASTAVTSVTGGSTSSSVYKWGIPVSDGEIGIAPPTRKFFGNGGDPVGQIYVTTSEGIKTYIAGDNGGIAIPCTKGAFKDDFGNVLGEHAVDLFMLQHKHSIPAHGHTIQIKPHGHRGSVSVEIPDHQHPLNEGIKVSRSNAGTTILNINGTDVTLLTSSESIKNNIDITQHIKIGEWNTITATTSGLARVNLYGTVEVVVKNYK